ncbi:hypothetical protein ACRAWF_22250 [Streptomyces sp. L7]
MRISNERALKWIWWPVTSPRRDQLAPGTQGVRARPDRQRYTAAGVLDGRRAGVDDT